MSKTVIISEDSLKRLGATLKLNPELYSMVKDGHTSLSGNKALPSDSKEFIYKLIKGELTRRTEEFNEIGDSSDIEGSVTNLRRLVKKAIDKEEAFHPQLEKICENTIMRLFPVPEDTVNATFRLTRKPAEDCTPRVMPEEDDGYDYEDVEDNEEMVSDVEKRRMIDALIQGGSYSMMKVSESYWGPEIEKLDPDLYAMYKEIDIYDMFLLYADNQKMDRDEPELNAYVSVRLGGDGKRTEIKARGILFPYLLVEAIRGFMELFSSHGLPEDNERAMAVVRRADFIIAEAWDMRLGIPIWERFWNVEKYGTRVLPYYFKEVCSLDTSEFNSFMKNVCLNTKKARAMRLDVVKQILHDDEYNRFKDRMTQKRVDRSVIEDGEINADELEDMIL